MDILQNGLQHAKRDFPACILNDGVFDLYESFIGKYRNSPLEVIVSSINSDLVNTMGAKHFSEMVVS